MIRSADKPRVVLYNPRAVFHTMPLGLLSVGSALDRGRFDVEIVDGRLETDPLTRVTGLCRGALCLGIGVLTGAPIRDALDISRAARRANPGLTIVWGGWHPSLFAEESLDEPSIDVSVQGQGEATFREIVSRLDAGLGLDGVAGITYRDQGRIVRNPPRPLEDMNALPACDYSLIPVERYFRCKKQRQLDYVTSTGCLFRCAFCADPFVYGRNWTAVSPQRLAGEVQDLWNEYGFSELAFQDETFFTYRDRTAEIATRFIESGLIFRWTATLRADQASRMPPDLFDLCVRSGMDRVMVGVESGSQEMLDWMKKDIRLDQVILAAERCRQHGIGATFPFIVGFPGESRDSVRATMNLMKRLRSMSPRFDTPLFYFKPYPGSAITMDLVGRGHRLPATLEQWADFDFIGGSGEWMTAAEERRVERFKFYNRYAWGPERWFKRPLQAICRWRCRHDYYGLPVEKLLVESLVPNPALS